jgi:hypothetical protein
MAGGSIGVKTIIEPGSTILYKRTAADVGAVLGRFLRGPHDKWVYVTSEEDFKLQFGETFLSGHEMDFEFVKSFFRASEENGKLWIRNVYYYGTDPYTDVTAAKSNTVAGGLGTDKRIWFEAYSRGEWGDDLTVEIRETMQRASGSGWVDILVKYKGETKKTYLNMSWDENEERNVRDVIPVDGDGWIIPRWDSSQLIPANGTYTFSGGDNGLTGPANEPLDSKHWIGESHPDGASGFYGLIPHLNDVSRRPTFILNQTGNESYAWDVYSGLTSFCRQYWLTHFSSPPSGLNRQGVYEWKTGNGDASKDKSTKYGEARVAWPWFYPRGAKNKLLVIPPCAADAGRMVARIHSSGGHVHEPYVGTDGDYGSLALVTIKLERNTGHDDREALNPLGICVISSDLGGIYLDGSRTMATDNRFLEMSTRRHLAVVIVSGILAQSRWMVHGLNDEGYPNSPGIWRRGTLSGQAYMRKFAADGAFTSKEMGVGWMFQIGEPYTTQSDISERTARGRVAFAPRACAEEIIISLGVEEGQLNASPAPAE